MSNRVLFIDEDTGRSGSTASLEYLVQGFEERGYAVYVLTWKSDEQARRRLMEHGQLVDGRTWFIGSVMLSFHFTFDRFIFSPKSAKTLIKDLLRFISGFFICMRAIAKVRPQLVYANEYAVVQSSLAARIMGIPSVTHIRSPFLKGSLGLRRFLISRLVVHFNQLIFAITRREADQLHARPSERHRIQVVGEFFSKRGLRSLDSNINRRLFGLPLKKKIVTMLGGIQEIKGTIDFLKAAHRLMSRNENVVFVLAGKHYHDGVHRKYFEQCMQLAEILKSYGCLHVLGEIVNSLELIAASDIIVSPSTEPHFSRPVIEAWGLGKPVVVARTSSTEELVIDEVNGLLTNPGDSHGIAESIIHLLSDAALCERLGLEGKKKTESEYDAERNLDTIVHACNSLLKSHSFSKGLSIQ